MSMDWDNLCWNPHEESVQQGETSGKEAGRLAGFRDGKAMGQVKGFELGMEVGFIRGFLEALEQDENVKKNERIQRSIDQLQKILEEESLQPDVIFQDAKLVMAMASKKEQESSAAASSNGDEEDSPSGESKVDVESKVQRIRARFKVLIVQLKIPKSTLKDVMDEAGKSTVSKDLESVPFEGGW